MSHTTRNNPTNDSGDDKFLADCLRYLDGQLSKQAFDAFQTSLHADPAKQAALIELALHREMVADALDTNQADRAIDTVLGQTVHARSSEPDTVDMDAMLHKWDEELAERSAQHARPLSARDVLSAAGYLTFRSLSRKPAVLAAAAAVLVLALVLLLRFTGTPTSPAPQEQPTIAQVEREPAATLTAEREARWRVDAGSDRPQVGTVLHAGQTLILDDGFAEITTNDGAVAVLEGPCTIELIDDNAIRLESGKLLGICQTASSQGFMVRTPHMDVTDLGTRFGVDASGPNATEVHVYEGVVEVARTSNGSTALLGRERLIEGQAVRAVNDVDGFTRYPANPLRFASITGPAHYLRESTGLGLAVGDTDPNWHIVAVNGTPTAEPIAMRVSDRGESGNPNQDRIASTPYHWLAVPESIAPEGHLGRTYTCRVTLQVSADFDRAGSQLLLIFAGGRAVDAVRINDRAVDLPAEITDRQTFFTPEIELALGTLMTADSNTIEIDVYDTDMSTRISAAFEIRPRDP